MRDRRKETLLKSGLLLGAETAVAPEPPWRCQAGIRVWARRGESRSRTLRAQRSSWTDEETGNLGKWKKCPEEILRLKISIVTERKGRWVSASEGSDRSVS